MNFLVIVSLLAFVGLVLLATAVAIHYSRIEKQIENGTKGGSKKVSSVLREAKDKVKTIKNIGIRETDADVKNAISEIVKKSESIIREVHRDPDDVRKARKFLNYYLDATVKVLSQYTLLKGKNIDSHKSVLSKVLPLLKDIKTGLTYEYQKLFEKEVMDLDVEIEVLKKTLEQDIHN